MCLIDKEILSRQISVAFYEFKVSDGGAQYDLLYPKTWCHWRGPFWPFRCLDIFVIVVFLSYLRTSWSRRDVDALRWRCGSVTWCRPSVPPSALTHHLVANKQTLQRRQHFYNTTTGDTCTTGCLSNATTFCDFCDDPAASYRVTQLPHLGFRRSETWATRSSAKWQINNAADPSSQLGQQLFLSFIQEHGKLTSLAAINQSCCFSFAFWRDSIISSNAMDRWKLDKYFKINEQNARTKTNDKSKQELKIVWRLRSRKKIGRVGQGATQSWWQIVDYLNLPNNRSPFVLSNFLLSPSSSYALPPLWW